MQNMFLLDSAASLWCRDNQKQEPGGGFGVFGGRWWGSWMGGGLGWSLHVRLFLMPSVLVRAGGSFAALQAQESSLALAFHTRSTVKACDRLQTPQPTPRSYPLPLLFGQLWIFERCESNSVRHATVQPHSVSAVVWTTWRGDLARTSPLFSFADHIRCQKLTVRWPKYNILDISLFPVFVQTKFDTDECCNGAPTLSKTIRDDREHAVHFKSVPQTPHRCCEHSREKQASKF